MNNVNAGFVGDNYARTGQSSSETALFDIFLTEFTRLKRIAAGMGLTTSDIEDVLQEVSIRVTSNADLKLTPKQSIAWLIKVTINQCILEHRRRKRFNRKAEEILRLQRNSQQAPTKPDEKAIKSEELEAVRNTLQKLDDSLLMVLVLRYFEGMNSNQISETLSLNASTVRSRLRDARMILANRLIERGIGP